MRKVTTVAAYCRVSTDQKDQANSFTAQQRFFRELVQRESGWQLYNIYADEGISGTSTKRRLQFLQMMEDARNRKFDLILTKEVSRFARNILDAISFTRELRGLGIGVYFVTDGINTLEPDAELRLSILGSIAQEESRRTSQRVKWGQTRQMEQGVVFGHSLLGYDLHNGVLTIEPEGAALVQWIYRQYAIMKRSSTSIAENLTEMTDKKWSPSQIIRILKNEKYVGDLVQKKTYTPDYLTHEKKKNNGAEPVIIIQNHHPPIIERHLWESTQAEIQGRSRRKTTGICCSNQNGLSGKIFCGKCGNVFVSRTKRRKDGSTYRFWRCNGNCGIGKTVADSLLKEAILSAIHMILPEFSEIEQSDLFFRLLVENVIVHPDRHLELLFTAQKKPITFFFV